MALPTPLHIVTDLDDQSAHGDIVDTSALLDFVLLDNGTDTTICPDIVGWKLRPASATNIIHFIDTHGCSAPSHGVDNVHARPKRHCMVK